MKINNYRRIGLSAAAVITLLIAVMILARPYRVFGDCMEPAIMDGQLCFLNRLAPYLRQYKINDIVLFKHDRKVWVSRIVALETDTIQISEGSVTVNGTPLQDASVRRNWTDWRYGTYAVDKPFQVPQGHVFVLSDNLSAHHDDSRIFGSVPKDSIVGLVW